MAMSISKLIYVVGIHSIIHGIFGMVFVFTSGYVNHKPGIVHSFLACHFILFLMGACTFCIATWRRPACARLFGILYIILVVIYLLLGISYFLQYLPFYANSIFDVMIYYSEVECWVGPEYPVTFWHIITGLLLGFILLWLFYGISLLKLAHCVCMIPCPPPPCAKICDPPAPPCCPKQPWYKKIFKSGRCCPAPPCPPCPPPPPKPCPQSPPPPPPPPCPAACPPPPAPPEAPPGGAGGCGGAKPEGGSSGGGKKTAKFVLTLKPGKICKG